MEREVLRLSEKIAYELRDTYMGRIMEGLLESNNSGHIDNFLEVCVEGRYQNEVVKVELIENGADGLVGEII